MAGRCLVGLDPGERWVGVARASIESSLALPVGTLDRRAAGGAADSVAGALRSMLDGDDVAAIIVGAPLRPDGAEDDQAGAFRAFGESVAAAMGVDCFAQNERFTSLSPALPPSAARVQRDRKARRPGGKSASRQRRERERSHAAAAARILQRWLDEHRDAARQLRAG